MKYLIFAMATLLLSACDERKALRTERTANADFDVEYLFESGGCKVYRFRDDGRKHYFTNCTETHTSYTVNCGKNCYSTRYETIGGKGK